MTVVEHRYNPKTKEYEISAVVSDILGLYGKPTANITGYPLYTREDLYKMGFEDKKQRRKYGVGISRDYRP